MPFNAVPKENFKGRENELSYLSQHAGCRDDALSRILLVEGANGIGKTELLKQLYAALFNGDGGAVPFYYSFRRATLQGTRFADDYLSRFVSQFLAYIKQDPALVDDLGVPAHRLTRAASARSLSFIPELVADSRAQAVEGGFSGQVLAAMHAPVVAARKSGRRVVVLLDNFHLAAHVHDAQPGDTPGVAGLFADAMESSVCRHVVSGSPADSLEAIFSDDSLRGKAERLAIGPLSENDAFDLFEDCCRRAGVEVDEECKGMMAGLGGNPLYIRNMARSFRKSGRRRATAEAFRECYAQEVCFGETAFYWSTVLRGCLEEPRIKALALGLLARSSERPLDADTARLSRLFDVPEALAGAALEGLRASGMARVDGSVAPAADTVMEDWAYGAYMAEVEGSGPESVREEIARRRFGPSSMRACFEIAIPMVSDAELVAARAVEQIAANADMGRRDIAELQHALIEACINAMEHSGSYDKKVYLRCAVHAGRIEVSIESPGKAFEPGDGRRRDRGSRRGMGLELMKGFMDDVRVERSGDRTRVVLVKSIKARKKR